MKNDARKDLLIMNSTDIEDNMEIQYPTDAELEDMYKEFTRSYPEQSWIYPF